jgi:hypothetical protein
MARTLAFFLSFFCVSFLIVASALSQEFNVLTAEEKEQGFELLFDGKTVSPDIWQDEKSIAGYPVENGVITCRQGGNLLTKKEYGDFIFRCEFKLPPGGNNGVGIRAESVNKDAAYFGMEIQVLDNSAEQYKTLRDWQYHGSIYGVVPAKRNAEKNDYQKPVGEWNYQEITAKGSKITVVLNGETIVDADISEFKTKPKPSGQAHPGLHREKGFIGFLGHNDPVQFRNVRILTLDSISEHRVDTASAERRMLNFRSRNQTSRPFLRFFRGLLD